MLSSRAVPPPDSLFVKAYLRLLHIYRTAVRFRLDELLRHNERAKLFRFLLRLPVTRRIADDASRGARLRMALESLGPIFIKFGQLLSTRQDLVPSDIADELALLQDQVPPFEGELATRLVEEALGAPVSKVFASFSTQPLASASVAQVHPAKLHTGESVVVKVIRPGIADIISDDISLLHAIANLVHKRVKGARRLRLREVVRDYELVIFDELNLMLEAANTSQLKRNFEYSDKLYVPTVYWDYCRENVMVIERIHGIPVNRIDELKAEGIDLYKLAETGVEIFFKQVFEHSFFHADMHPGNIFVRRGHQQQPQYIALDCAIIGTLSASDQQYLARNLLAIFKRDYRRVAELHVESGWVPPDTPINAFESTMRALCEPIFQKPLSEISFGLILLQLFQTASRFDMEVQPSLVLLQKTLLNVEGLGKQLYPELDLWQTALPFLEEWQSRRLSPFNNLRIIRERLPEWIEKIPDFPDLVYATLEERRLHHIRMKEQADHFLEKQQLAEQESRRSRYRAGATLVVLAALSMLPPLDDWLDDVGTASALLLVSGLLLMLYRR